ncbi:pentapeptide repeat-containing protein [Dyadobacter sandarakinus]|uniref:Pentapeptide repeat-containing protein n=1 Tax=Dyadobacter sandarakinus TaxID=2747268 RepID=A0ABX7I9P1_9BACT|nr:pentapeptide repeat-containing protein [Dyadobacter sandarakinus]QRR02443.1 pentapeptide repeat-containing protein [Dyadobacter sandarakinus]
MIRKIAARHEHTLIENKDFGSSDLEASYEYVEFRNCSFLKLAGTDFMECVFHSCNLSNAMVRNCKIQNVRFNDCKLVGINFNDTKTFGFSVAFENCNLDYASFDNRKMNQSTFVNCKMHGVNFSNADLSKCTIERCDLDAAIFSYTNLSGLDFTTNYNFSIDPEINTLKKTKFTVHSLPGLLTKYNLDIQY